MQHPWIADLRRSLAQHQTAILVSVARADGSTPRDAGAKMVVTASSTFQTIGGGHLEWRAIDIAREMLRLGADKHDGPVPPFAQQRLERLSLGPSLGQCCGGAVTLAFERIAEPDRAWLDALAQRLADGLTSIRQVSFAPDDGVGNSVGNNIGRNGNDATRVTLRAEEAPFGDVAGRDHSNAAVPTSAPMPPHVPAAETTSSRTSLLWDGTGFDDNAATLTETLAPPALQVVVLGAGHVGCALVRILQTLPCRVIWADERDAPRLGQSIPDIDVTLFDTPDTVIDQAPSGACFVVMTHSHALDQQLCERILRRGDYRYFGLIGSDTKRVQFERRLAARGIAPEQLARMICPIGVPGIADKAPEVIAVAVAAELLQVGDRTA